MKERAMLAKWKRWVREAEGRLLGTAIVLGTGATLLLMAIFSMGRQQQELLQDNFLRFHVLANSDQEEDQELKLQVRDAVIDYLEPQLRASAGKEETRQYIAAHLPQITDVAGRTVRRAGSDMKVRVLLGSSEFPTKSYGNVTLPAGRYEALRIELGAAEGKNWWCVMFPSLCFVEETKPEQMEADLARHLEEEANALVHRPRSFKFKLVEWYHALFD